ncbi:hypothetical protein C7D71_31260, partial [Klebsiella pneumoniae]
AARALSPLLKAAGRKEETQGFIGGQRRVNAGFMAQPAARALSPLLKAAGRKEETQGFIGGQRRVNAGF